MIPIIDADPDWLLCFYSVLAFVFIVTAVVLLIIEKKRGKR